MVPAPPARQASEAVLEVDDLRVDFATEAGLLPAVRGLSLRVGPGEVLGVVGESGAGKSVTALAIMGLLPRNAVVGGSARCCGHDLVGAPERELNAVRGRHLAMVFQEPMSSLNPAHTVGAQIAEAVRAHSVVSKADAWRRAVDLLDLVGIPRAAALAGGHPHELSGGMRQRVMIAMAMANEPEIVIADEPTTALDVTVQAQVLDLLRGFVAERGMGVVLITHDLGVVASIADRVVVMYGGRVVEEGSVDDVFYRPRMPYTLGLLGSLPRMATGGRTPLTPIGGAPPSLLDLAPGCPFEPRCTSARGRCVEAEPSLEPAGHPAHRSACHYRAELTIERRPDLSGRA